MIHIVAAANRCLFEDELRELRRIDCANSVHAAAREADGLANGVDHFDDDDAIHHLALEDGRVYGASRLTPTSKPHRLGDTFRRRAIMRGVPRHPAAYEWTPAQPAPMPIDASALEAAGAFYGIGDPILLPKDPRPSITREITL